MPRKRFALAVLALAALIAVPATTAPAATKTTKKKAPTTTKKATTATTVAATASTGAAATTVVPASGSGDSPISLDALYAAAKKEGKVTIYTTANAVQMDPAAAGFESRYPGVKVTWSRTSTPELITKFGAEAASGVGEALPRIFSSI